MDDRVVYAFFNNNNSFLYIFYICNLFIALRSWFPDELINGNYQFNDDSRYKTYLTKDSYDDIDKINGFCLFLFNGILIPSYSYEHYEKSNINAVGYILAWLSYKLNQKTNDGISNLMDFYNKHMKNLNEYQKSIEGATEHKNYIEVIKKNIDLLNIDLEDMSKFYEAFILLCDMYDGFDDVNPNCEKYLEYNNEFLKKYEELKKYSSTSVNNSYIQMLSTLSNDYYNLKSKCNHFSSLLTYSLISIAFIFVAIPIFLGISYKYSLFGFRKRLQKQYLREKLKNIKKRMNY
ncbi:putative yir3 protein [Plasmodium yoelii yoelii]|uniref:Yir3 protein n=1 Tax=Plasmodium yoelii yoelii TaxID=73239 RepID=Q7RB30_PLAYO|nr:putative yir3 protein [Plasmodium yoelii yoelii]